MKIGIYSRVLKEKDIPFVKSFFENLLARNTEISVHKNYWEQIKAAAILPDAKITAFDFDCLAGKVDYVCSIGGDGTLLDTVPLIRDSGIPVLGINVGRLGFLTSVSDENAMEAIEALENEQFEIDTRTLIELDSEPRAFEVGLALNEFSIQKKDTTSMITIHTYVDGTHLNSYWADGLIVATPTGSTGYSLSCGGPIIAPYSSSFVITPMAPHNLTVRPLIINDQSEISFKIESRNPDFLCILDSRNASIDMSYELKVKRANFKLNLLRLKKANFFKTIRDKLNWGLDERNQ